MVQAVKARELLLSVRMKLLGHVSLRIAPTMGTHTYLEHTHVHVSFVLTHCYEHRSKKQQLLQIGTYTPMTNEKISDTKYRVLLGRVLPLTSYFNHVAFGFGKCDAAERVTPGCMMYPRTIMKLANQFLSTSYTRRVSQPVQQDDDTTLLKQVSQTCPKEALKFAHFNMGNNRKYQSVMQDEIIRARAVV